MSQNPYQPPSSAVGDVEPQVVVDASVNRDIKNGWIAALISGAMTLVLTVVSISTTPVLGLDAWTFFDVLLIFGLAYGIYRRSRACALILLLYFLVSKFLLLQEGASASSLPLAFVFVYFYSRAVLGTFRYRKAAKA